MRRSPATARAHATLQGNDPRGARSSPESSSVTRTTRVGFAQSTATGPFTVATRTATGPRPSSIQREPSSHERFADSHAVPSTLPGRVRRRFDTHARGEVLRHFHFHGPVLRMRREAARRPAFAVEADADTARSAVSRSTAPVLPTNLTGPFCARAVTVPETLARLIGPFVVRAAHGRRRREPPAGH